MTSDSLMPPFLLVLGSARQRASLVNESRATTMPTCNFHPSLRFAAALYPPVLVSARSSLSATKKRCYQDASAAWALLTR